MAKNWICVEKSCGERIRPRVSDSDGPRDIVSLVCSESVIVFIFNIVSYKKLTGWDSDLDSLVWFLGAMPLFTLIEILMRLV